MSKSKGNVVTPMPLFEQYGTDAVRYWAISRPAGRRHRVQRGPDEGRPPAGHQAAQRHQVRARHRRATASPASAERRPTPSTWPCSPGSTRRSPRRRWRSRASTTPAPSSAPRRSSGGSATTTSSWSRAGPTAAVATSAAASARAALGTALDALLRLLAPTCRSPPRRRGAGRTTTSVHAARGRQPHGGADPGLDLDAVSEVLARVRRAKTEAKRSQRAPVATLTIRARRAAARCASTRPATISSTRSPSPSSPSQPADELAVDVSSTDRQPLADRDGRHG